MRPGFALVGALAIGLAACGQESGVARDAVNPWEWSSVFGFNQGEIVSGATRTLYMAGQLSVDESGQLIHEGDIRSQFGQAFSNLDAVLDGAGMDRSNVVQMTIYTTEIDGILANWDVYMELYAAEGYTPPLTFIGIDRLYDPAAMVEIKAVAVD